MYIPAHLPPTREKSNPAGGRLTPPDSYRRGSTPLVATSLICPHPPKTYAVWHAPHLRPCVGPLISNQSLIRGALICSNLSPPPLLLHPPRRFVVVVFEKEIYQRRDVVFSLPLPPYRSDMLSRTRLLTCVWGVASLASLFVITPTPSRSSSFCHLALLRSEQWVGELACCTRPLFFQVSSA